MPGEVVWTDGSKTVKGEVELVGAGGRVRSNSAKSFSFRVGGPAKAVRGEMAAVAWATSANVADRNVPLTVITDCRSLLYILQRWKRNDFARRPEDEDNWDILQDLLANIRSRTATTTVVWVKAHSGDVGNEAADVLAEGGTTSEEVRWELTTEPLQLYDRDKRMVSPAGWSRRAAKTATTFCGMICAAWLRRTATAACTHSIIRTERGRQHLGAVYLGVEDGISDWERRAFMQARAACYPSNANLHMWGMRKSPACDLCGGQRETLGHIQTTCTILGEAGVYHRAHDMVAEAILTAIQTENKDVRVSREQTLGKRLGGGCPPELRRQKPDAFLEWEVPQGRKRIWLVDFQRGGMDFDRDENWRAEYKHNKYHLAVCAVRDGEEEATEVEAAMFVIGVLGSFREREWHPQLEKMGMSRAGVERVCREGVRATVRAHAMVWTVIRKLGTICIQNTENIQS
jgi:ribonuclease HI